MKRPLSLDEVRSTLPDLEALRPLMDRMMAISEPDGARRWAASGELGTVGERLVDLDRLPREIPRVLGRIREHLAALFGAVEDALRLISEHRDEEAVEPLLRAAELERGQGRLEQAEAFAAAAMGMSARLRDRRAALPAFLAGARIARSRGLGGDAASRYREALNLGREMDRPDAVATGAVGLGNVAVDRARWAEARRWYAVAETALERGGPALPERWHVPLNRSIVAREEGDLAGAEAELRTARREAREIGDESAFPVLQNAWGQILMDRGEADSAELAFRWALEAAGDPDARVTIGVNLADALLALGRALEAGEVARRAEETALRAAVVPRLPEVYRALGEIAARRGHAEAFLFFERALEIVRDRGLPEVERARVLEAYGAYGRSVGETEAAEARLDEARKVHERLRGEDA